MITTLLILFMVFLFLGGGLIWLITLADILRNEFRDSTQKLLWVLLIIFLPIIGVLFYWLIGRSQRIPQS